MTPLRQRMIVEMIMRGLARHTQESYLWGVISLANHYNRSPDRISRDRRTIRIDQGKGQKDRYTVLGQRAIVVLDQYRSRVAARR